MEINERAAPKVKAETEKKGETTSSVKRIQTAEGWKRKQAGKLKAAKKR